MQGRIEWIDIAKGIGILLVIAGHTISLQYSSPVYAFHMPLFFSMSGLLFNDKGEGFGRFFISKARSVLRPWAVMLIISFLICICIPVWRSEITIQAMMADLYTANTNVVQNSSLWYLVCYFFLLIFFYFINRIKRTPIFIIVFILIAIALLWIREGLNLTSMPFKRLPFKIDSALVALVFFSVAYWFKDKIFVLLSKKIHWTIIILVIIAAAALSVFNGWANINSLDFGEVRLLYYPTAFLGIAAVCLVSRALSNSSWSLVKSVLCFFGENSLIVFGFQSLLIRLYYLFFNSVQGLSMELYGMVPAIHQIGSFFVVSFVLSPLVVYLFKILRRYKVSVL